MNAPIRQDTFESLWPRVHHRARMLSIRYRIDADDATQIGAMALMRALESGDPSRGILNFAFRIVHNRLIDEAFPCQKTVGTKKERRRRPEVRIGLVRDTVTDDGEVEEADDVVGHALAERVSEPPRYEELIDLMRVELSERERLVLNGFAHDDPDHVVGARLGLSAAGCLWIRHRAMARIREACDV